MASNPIYKTSAGKKELMKYYDEILTLWPIEHTHLTIPTCYGDTFVIASGNPSAPALVLLHGSASNSATWMGDIVDFGKHFRVYAVDIPGEAGKSNENRFPWDGHSFNEWLDDVLEGLVLTKVFMGGISLGAWATIKYAIHNPQQVEKAFLLVPAGIYPIRLGFALRMIILSSMGEWGRKKLGMYMLNGAEFSEEAEHFLYLIGKHFNPRMGAPPLISDEELRCLTTPVLYLAGEKDTMLNTSKTAERMRSLVPNLAVKIYEDDGHATINKAPDVITFLKGNAYG
jgi:pimeloyl-ACP methyl ester carboxylesterase